MVLKESFLNNGVGRIKMETAEKDLIYAYCVTDIPPHQCIGGGGKEPNLKKLKDLGEDLYFVAHQDLYAIVTRVSKDEFGEENLKKNLADMKWVERRVREHIKVISKVMKGCTVVPFKFGTIFKTEDSLKNWLGDYSQQVKDNIANLEGKEEWSVKIYCDFVALNKKIAQTDEEIKKLDHQILSSSPGKAYLLKKKKEELAKEKVNRKINEGGQHCFERLNGCAIDSVINKLLPKEVTEKENEIILNTVYLVDKGKVDEFLKVAEKLKNRYDEFGFEFDCAGPWPPYNFAVIKEIEKER